jgi:N-formylglutamate amidohydrolase
MALIYHIPHASIVIPSEWRKTIILSDRDLQFELLQMTDRHTDDIFRGTALGEDTIVEFPISRLVVDPERFVDDRQEIMSQRGMGVVYLRRHDGSALRPDLCEKDHLVARYYEPHHEQFEKATSNHLERYGRAIIIDCHSFPSTPLPYELVQDPHRPHICIGTDAYHTPNWLSATLLNAYKDADYEVSLDTPFAGTIVPMRFYRQDPRVNSVMIEIRRDMYIDERTGLKNQHYAKMVRDTETAIAAVRAAACQSTSGNSSGLTSMTVALKYSPTNC